MSKDKILKDILSNIEIYGKGVSDDLKKHGNRFKLIEDGNNKFILKWSLYPIRSYVINILKVAGYKEIGTNALKKDGIIIQIDYTDAKDKEEMDRVSQALYLLKKTGNNLDDKGNLSSAKSLVYIYGDDEVGLRNALGYIDDSYIDKNGRLTAHALTKLRKVAVSLADSVDNNYIGGEEDSQQINMLIQAVDVVKAKDIFSKQTDRKLTASLRKLLKETMINTFQTRFEKGIGKAFVENQSNLINSYKDAELVGSNFNPLDYTDYFSLIEDMRDNVVAFDFVKANGDHRRALGTRNKKIISQYVLNKDDKTIAELDSKESALIGLDKGYIRYFDLEAEDFRMFRLFPTGKSGNKSRLYSCVITGKDKPVYKRPSWIRIPVTSQTWIGVWDKFVNIDKANYSKEDYAEVKNVRQEELFTSIALPTGYAKDIPVDNEVITKFSNHVRGIKEVKEDDLLVKEQIIEQREKDSADAYYKIFGSYIYPKLVEKELKSNGEIGGYGKFAQELTKNAYLTIKESIFKDSLGKPSPDGRGIIFTYSNNKYFVSPELFANITNGIVYGTTLTRKVFEKWDNIVDKSLYGYDIKSEYHANLLKLGQTIINQTKKFENRQKLTDDDLKILQVKKVIEQDKDVKLKTVYENMDLKVFTTGGVSIVLNKEGLYLYPKAGSKNAKGVKHPLRLWVRDTKSPITNQLRESVRPYLENKAKRLLQNGAGVSDDDYKEVLYILSKVYSGVWGKR